MIEKLMKYKEYLFEKITENALDGNILMCKYYASCEKECVELLELFKEMKLSVNEWHRIREITRGL